MSTESSDDAAESNPRNYEDGLLVHPAALTSPVTGGGHESTNPPMLTPDHDLPAILSAILPGYTLPRDGTHGLTHWARVLENGLRLCEATGADTEVVTLFAIFHDARRVNEYRDDGHGHRGADLAASLRGSLVHLDDRRFEVLYEACRLHTDGGISGDPAMQVCWDADRLDLGRVGIRPRPSRLCTPAAHGLIDWAHERAEREHVPAGILAQWGCDIR